MYPRLVQDLDFSTRIASMVLTAYGLASTVARLLHGFLLDFKLISVTNLNLLSTFICGLSPVLNPLVTSVAGQFVLSIVLGAAGGVMDTMVVPVTRQYVPIDKVSNALGFFYAMTVVGLLMGTQLMGNDVLHNYIAFPYIFHFYQTVL